MGDVAVLLHIVLMKRRPEVGGAEIEALREAVLGLGGLIPGIVAIDWGPNTSPEGLGQGYDLGFVVAFADAAARDAYLPHPDHRATVPSVHAVAESVLVYDLEVAGAPTGTV